MSLLGERIKYIRNKRKLSQKEMAKELGVSNVQLSRYETGERKPDPEMLSSIADFLDISTDYLLGRTDDLNKLPKAYDSLSEINKLVKEYGIEDFGFFDIEQWKKLSPEDLDELRRHFEWVAQKAKERNEEKE
ncbi:helix-turn-helix domain-containing protein [Niallia taxi]|uniref:helix-turn-helix domain-containing protein n=1 Tax=Niallia taxi TaxID=2499688 RepID=UPI003F625A72